MPRHPPLRTLGNSQRAQRSRGRHDCHPRAAASSAFLEVLIIIIITFAIIIITNIIIILGVVALLRPWHCSGGACPQLRLARCSRSPNAAIRDAGNARTPTARTGRGSRTHFRMCSCCCPCFFLFLLLLLLLLIIIIIICPAVFCSGSTGALPGTVATLPFPSLLFRCAVSCGPGGHLLCVGSSTAPGLHVPRHTHHHAHPPLCACS